MELVAILMVLGMALCGIKAVRSRKRHTSVHAKYMAGRSYGYTDRAGGCS